MNPFRVRAAGVEEEDDQSGQKDDEEKMLRSEDQVLLRCEQYLTFCSAGAGSLWSRTVLMFSLLPVSSGFYIQTTASTEELQKTEALHK